MADFKKLFYSQLMEHFIGQEVHGQSGYVNLMSLKNQYFAEIKPFINRELAAIVGTDETLEKDLYDRLYTFFYCYLNDTGTPFFAKTPPQKNLYEKVYNDKDDVALFWKTQRLYYVKSEEDYKDLETKPEGCTVNFKFKTDYLIRKKNNVKKTLLFILTGHSATELTFQVIYEDKSLDKNKLLRDYLGLNELNDIKDKLIEKYNTQLHGSIEFLPNGIDLQAIPTGNKRRDWLIYFAKDDAIGTVCVIIAPAGTEQIIKYLQTKQIPVNAEQLTEAFKTFRRQTVIDYFIHKDAEGFLKEQFDLYVYNWLCNDLKTEFDVNTVARMQKVKRAAYAVIEYIAKFENELKAIWEKPKLVFNSNYVITLDRIAEKKPELIKLITDQNGIVEQVQEWQELGIVQEGFNKNHIVDSENKLKPEYAKLPIDTKHFKGIELTLLKEFDNLDNSLDGWLIKSENYQALNTILPKFQEQVQTIYIDPPFNTGEDFGYIDKYQDATWLSLIYDRLDLSKCMLNSKGSIFYHIDRYAYYYSRLLFNNLYNPSNFKAEISWDTCGITGFKPGKNNWVNNQNFILHFAKDINSNYFIKLFDILEKEERDRLKLGWLDLLYDEKSEEYYIEKWNDTLERVVIETENKKHPVGMVWSDIYSFLFTQVGNNESFFFKTQKPENLIRRIIQATSNKRDLVLDFFSGIGTTIAVAHKLNRRWMGVEIGDYCNTFYTEDNCLKIGIIGRMKIVFSNDQKFEVFGHPRHPQLSRNINWQGGGFFKYYELDQYEDALQKAIYKPRHAGEELDKYSFMAEQKLLYALDIDYENKKSKIDFSKIYPNKQIDLAETFSNLTGHKIKRLTDKGCILFDRSTGHELPEIDFSDITLEKYPYLSKLIWWNSK